MLGLLLGFAIAHSGLAALRPWAEKRIGPVSTVSCLQESVYLAVVLIIFNHCIRSAAMVSSEVPGVQTPVWVLSAISLFLIRLHSIS